MNRHLTPVISNSHHVRGTAPTISQTDSHDHFENHFGTLAALTVNLCMWAAIVWLTWMFWP